MNISVEVGSSLTAPQRRLLTLAAVRRGGYLCPVPWKMGPAAEMSLINALRRKGLATTEACPRITDAGLKAVGAV
jgi:hypothetical protein